MHAGRLALQRTRRDRDLPVRADRARAARRSVGEGRLGDQAVAQRDQRVAALEDPGVHDVTHRLAGDLLDGVPQVGRLRVRVAVLAQVVADAVATRLFAEVLLEHAQDTRALFVGEAVEHTLRVVRRDDLILNWSRRVQPVD